MDRPLLSQVQKELIGAGVRELEGISDFLAGLRAAVQTAQDTGVIFCGQALHDGDANHGGQCLQLRVLGVMSSFWGAFGRVWVHVRVSWRYTLAFLYPQKAGHPCRASPKKPSASS